MINKILRKINFLCSNLKVLNNNKKNLKKINKEKKDKINVVFICQLPSLWNSLKTVYEQALRNSNINTFLIAIPDCVIGSDSKENIYLENVSYSYLKKSGYDVINGYENGVFFDLQNLNPDYVFLPRPYDDYLPEKYKASTLVVFTRVCYIPYGFSITNDCMSTIFNYSFLKNTYLFFPDSENSKKFVQKCYRKYFCHWNKIGPVGYPRFDLLNVSTNQERKIESFLWTPRWTSETKICGTTFFEYIDNILDFFINHKDLKLFFRPHPLLFRNFLATGELTEAKYENILSKFRNYENLFYDDPVNDYLITFNEVDALITDPTSLLPEFYITGKPVIYCSDSESFNQAGKIMGHGLYYANSWKEVEKLIEQLVSGHDDLKENRFKSLRYLNTSESNGLRVCETLLFDYYRNI